MQGRQGQGKEGKEPWDRTSSDSHAALNGTGKQRAVPRRPPGMAKLDTPPAVQRVGRPQRQTKPPKTWRRRLLIFGGILVICGIITFVIAYGLTNLFIGVGQSSGAANTATDFLLNLKSQNYDQAYKDLDATITVTLRPEDFKQMALQDDHCYGLVTDFNEVQGSATTSSDNNTQSYTYDITRSKLTKTYQMTLTIHKDSDGNWDITNYSSNGNNLELGPAPPTCK